MDVLLEHMCHTCFTQTHAIDPLLFNPRVTICSMSHGGGLAGVMSLAQLARPRQGVCPPPTLENRPWQPVYRQGAHRHPPNLDSRGPDLDC